MHQIFPSALDDLQRHVRDYFQDLNLNDLNSAGALAFLWSKWFTRGWTLQGLLAPLKVQFYLYEWNYIADRGRLARSISWTARIDCAAPTDNPKPLKNYSIAARMPWASAWISAVLEDQAYCLLSIFEVQMPLLYREGAKAFQRIEIKFIEQGHAH